MSGNELFSLILMAAILTGIGVFVAQPFFRPRPENILADEYADTPMQHLLSRKDSIYTALKELEFDFSTGKLSDEDYEALREKFSGEAADVLMQIDEVEADAKKPAKSKKAAAGACETCGFKIKPGDRFCKSCGSQLA